MQLSTSYLYMYNIDSGICWLHTYSSVYVGVTTLARTFTSDLSRTFSCGAQQKEMFCHGPRRCIDTQKISFGVLTQKVFMYLQYEQMMWRDVLLQSKSGERAEDGI